MVEDALDVTGRQGSARIQIKLEEAVAILVVQDGSFGAIPKMKGDVTCLNRRNGRQALIVMGPFDVVYFGRVERLHANVLDDVGDHGSRDMLFVGLRTGLRLHAQQEVMMLDSFELSRILVGQRLHSPRLLVLRHTLTEGLYILQQ